MSKYHSFVRIGRIISGLVFVLGLSNNPSLPHAAAATTLVEEGKARATIVLPESPTQDEVLAAAELREHVRKISGVELPCVLGRNSVSGHNAVLLGRAAPEAMVDAVRRKSNSPAAFAVMVEDGGIAIRGLPEPATEPPRRMKQPLTTVEAAAKLLKDRELAAHGRVPQPLGTRNGVYELLEQIGVRWFLPAEIGTVIPDKATIRVQEQKTIQTPSFPSRYLQAVRAPVWESRLRSGGMRFPSSHGIPGFGHGAELYKKHPEWYALIDGERRPRQLCVSNPRVMQRAIEHARQFFRERPNAQIIGMGPFDGRGFCECEECRALDGGDYDPFGHYTSMTDRYVWFFNKVLEGMENEFPEKRIGFYAYSVYNRPPVKWDPDDRIVPAVALITLCRMHGMENPVCPEKSYQKWIVQEWGKLVPEVYDRGYWFNLADPGLPFFQISRVAREVPLGRELGIRGWRVEAPYNWASSAPTRYLAMKLMWNHEQDVELLLDDFYTKFFGPAAKPMRTYMETMDHARRDADYHTGSSWDVPKVYDETVRAAARQALKRAATAVPDTSVYAKRVTVFRDSFDYLEAFIAMMNRRMNHNYQGAMAALKEMDSLREKQWSYRPKMISRKAEEYLRRFFRPATEQAHAKTTGGNELIATVDSGNWRFQIDPEQVGRDIGLFRENITGGSWQRMDASSSWSNTGLRYYKGDSWYRQTVNIPQNAQGKRVFLWVGGVDESAEVWLNGQLVGEGGGRFRPWDLDTTAAIQPGEPNQLVLRVTNAKLNELGTGGITGPVMFYSPADPDSEPTGDQTVEGSDDLETIGSTD
ncbi:MAG: DUF4838 domain-containing protein [Planctomycetota bacterium]